jgi:hypothetical protein
MFGGSSGFKPLLFLVANASEWTARPMPRRPTLGSRDFSIIPLSVAPRYFTAVFMSVWISPALKARL